MAEQNRSEARVHDGLFSSEDVIGKYSERSTNRDGEKFVSLFWLVLNETHVEKYNFASWTRKSADGKWQSKPHSEMRDVQSVRLSHILKIGTRKQGKRRVLLIESDRKVIIEESVKTGRKPWSNNKERAYAIEFEGEPSMINGCRRAIANAIPN